MPSADGFPRELLKQSKAARLDYFHSYTVAHPLLKEVDDKLWQALRVPGDAPLICLYGPTGIGKTTVLRRTRHRLLEQALAAMAQDPGHLPVAGVDAVAPDSGNFSWRDYYRRALEALDDPFVEAEGEGDVLKRGRMPAEWRSGGSTAELRRALEKGIKHRRLVAFIIDDAQHLTKMASGRKLQDQMDCVKSLALISGTVHVLAGTYELLAFRNLSGQLTRRSTDIHFRRYRAEDEAEAKAWRSVVWAFQRHLPLAEEPPLLEHWEYCYERSLGCVGLLKQWLARVLLSAVEGERRSVALQQLEREAFTASQCEKIATEILEGERQLVEKQETRAHLRVLIGLKGDAESGGDDGAAGRELRPAARRRRQTRVGRRQPQRDPVGVKGRVR